MEHTKFARILSALGEDTRIRIFEMLRDGSLCACRILEKFQISQPTLSHHMKVLCGCGLVKSERQGKWTYYSIDCGTLQELLDFLGDTKCRKG